MPEGRTRAVLIRALVLALIAALLTAACGTASGPGDRAAPSLSWEPLAEADLSDEIARWVEEHQGEIGVFQQIFGDRTVILVSWGERPTGGYAVEVLDVQPAGESALRLRVKLQEPAAGDVVTAAITYPRAVIAVTPSDVYALEPQFEGATFFKNEAFEILEPAPFVEVGERLRVRGKARVFEAMLMVRLEDGHDVLAEQPVMASAGAPEWGDFDVELALSRRPTSPNGVLQVYESSAKDGSPIHVLTIPVRFADWD